MFFELNSDYIDCEEFYRFSIKHFKEIYFHTGSEDVECWFGDLFKKKDNLPLSWDEVQDITGGQTIDSFEASKYRDWKNSWLLNNEEIKANKIIFHKSLIDQNSIMIATNEKEFNKWFLDTGDEKLFCIHDSNLFCKKEVGLFCNYNVGVFFGFFKDIFTPPVESTFRINEFKNQYAYFIVDDEMSNIRKKFLEKMTDIHIKEQIEKRKQQKEYEIGFFQALFDYTDSEQLYSMHGKEKIESFIKDKFPRHKNKIESGYDFEEFIGLEFIMDEYESIYSTYWPKQNENGKIEIHITTKLTSAILTDFLKETFNLNKIRKLYHKGSLEGEKRTSIMIKLKSIFKFIEGRTKSKNINSFIIYEKIFLKN